MKRKPAWVLKDGKIQDAIESLQKALQIEDPDISINMRWGLTNDDAGKKFMSQIKDFIKAYKEYYGIVDKVKVNLFL